MAALDIPIGTIADATVESNTLRGVVRYCGKLDFTTGRWVGMELSEPKGKNDGSVKGKRYFQCKPNHGIFVKLSQVAPVELPGGSRASSSKPTRQNSLSVSRLNSGSPTARTPQVAHAESPEPRMEKRSSLVLQTRPTGSRAPETPLRSSVVLPRPPPVRLDSPVQEKPSNIPSPKATSPIVTTTSQIQPHDSPSSPHPASHSPIAPNAHSEDQDLRTRIKFLEARRAEENEQIRQLQGRLSEADTFLAQRPKLVAKLRELQEDAKQTKQELHDQYTKLQEAESKVVELSERLELATLDKEMAEVRAESAELEVDELKEQLESAKVEIDVLRGSGNAASGNSTDGTQTLAFIQLERQNERLKEALLRLRDISQETELDQRRKIAELEKELAASEEMQSEFDSTLQNLANADVQIESLKQQLDDAMGAEEMLVQLTERNLLLGEKIEEMRVVIEDLEALKELNDELEENHVETEKALQEDIEAKEAQLREATRKIADLEEAILDYDQTIGQFRELVSQLTAELENLRTEHQSAQSASALAASQTATVMSLNLKLQSSASKSQAKNIELELQNLKTRQANELLQIVQPYLPQVYMDMDGDATNTYLFFKRMASKADLLNSTLAERYSLPESLNGHVTEPLIGICEMRGRIAHLSVLCKRFASTLRRCDPQSFLNIGRIYSDINPLEKRLDMHVDLLKREEFRSLECVTDVNTMVNRFEHLTDLYLPGSNFDLGEKELDLALSLDHDIDFFASALAWTRTSLLEVFKDDDIDNEMNEEELEVDLVAPLQKILDQCRNVRTIARKIVKRVEDLTGDSSALKAEFIPRLSHANGLMELALKFGVQLAQEVRLYVIDIKEKKEALKLTRVLTSVRSTAGEIKAGGGTGSWQTVADLLSQLQRDAADVLSLATESENVMKITGVAPWLLRVEEIKALAAVNVDAERKVTQLNEEIQELVRGIKHRDQSIKESVVKIQTMERRMEASKKQADALIDLEDQLVKARKQEKAYEEAMEQLQADLDNLEQETVRLKQSLNTTERQAGGTVSSKKLLSTCIAAWPYLGPGAPQVADFELAAPVEASTVEASHLLEQIESLKGAVRFLRTENGYLKGQEMLKDIQSLPSLAGPASGRTSAGFGISLVPPPSAQDVDDTPSDDIDDDHSKVTSKDAKAGTSRIKGDAGQMNKEESVGNTGVRKGSLQALSTESKLLYRELLEYSASPKLVDLGVLEEERKQGWIPQRRTAAYRLWERKREGDRLRKQVQGLQLQAARLTSLGPLLEQPISILQMSVAQIDLLEAIPFVREITALDLLDLPQGLFESLPKPCNLKRSAASGGPIWPPVLTKVLCDGLLVLHHKQHLVGKQGLEEHYNWLSAFIYRQTRSWCPQALSSNTVRIDPLRTIGQPLPQNTVRTDSQRTIGIIRNRKQISSKVQTIGEYLKDTHWAYVVQGPRQPKDAPQPANPSVSKLSRNSVGSSEAEASLPELGPVDSQADQPHTSSPQLSTSRASGDHSRSLDFSHVSLELVPLPPTPFSLPSTPDRSPFLYPSEVPDFEYSDAQALGYDPSAWPEFEAQYHSINEPPPLPAILETSVPRLGELHPYYKGDIVLHSTSLDVHIGAASAHRLSQSSLQENHQLGLLAPRAQGLIHKLHISALDASTQLTIRSLRHTADKLYHVDLPIYLPSSPEDRLLLAQKLSSGYHVNAITKFSIHSTGNDNGHSLLTAREGYLKAESSVYYIPLSNGAQPALKHLPGYDEASYLTVHHGNKSLAAPGPACSFIAYLWSNALKDPRYSSLSDLTSYKLVQKVSLTADGTPVLAIVYSLKLASTPGETAAVSLVSNSAERPSSASSSPGIIQASGKPIPMAIDPGTGSQASNSPSISSRVHGRSHSYSPLVRDGRPRSRGIIHGSPQASLSPRMALTQGSIGPVRTVKSHVSPRVSSNTTGRYSAEEGTKGPYINASSGFNGSPVVSPEIITTQHSGYPLPRVMSADITNGLTTNITSVPSAPTDCTLGFPPFPQAMNGAATSNLVSADYGGNTPPYEYLYSPTTSNVLRSPQRNATYPIPRNVHYNYPGRSLPFNSGSYSWVPQYSLRHT
ncbi:hypothetical protein FRC17_010222 [Serendipita sp. 399]|nr:hypothetical protein FRC17_010222 [Serendipita sp. 399]